MPYAELSPPRATGDEQALSAQSIRRIQQMWTTPEDADGRRRLQEEHGKLLALHLGLIHAEISTVLRRRGGPFSRDDLLDEAVVVMVKSARFYRQEAANFSTLLVTGIRRSFQRLFNRHFGVITAPDEKLRRAHADFRRRHHRPAAGMQDLVEAGLISAADAMQILNAQTVHTGGDPSDEGGTADRAPRFEDAVADPREDVLSEIAKAEHLADQLARVFAAIESLDTRVALVLRARQGIGDDGTMTGTTRSFKDIANEMGISVQKAVMLHRKGMQLVRNELSPPNT